MSQIPLSVALANLWPTVTTAANGGASDPALIIYLNDMLERFYLDEKLDFVGKFEDLINWSVQTDAQGQQTIGLPGYYINAEYIHDNLGDIPIRSAFSRYEDSRNRFANERHADDLGDNFCTWFDFPTPGTLFAQTAAAVTGGPYYLTIQGLDQNGDPVNDANGLGERLTLSVTGATTVNTFSKVTSIIKTDVNTLTNLFVVNSGVKTQIGQYQTNEQYPRCRRYYICAIPYDAVILSIKCRRRFIPVSFPNDMITPGVMGALKNGLMSINFENANDVQRQEYHWSKAKYFLDGELLQYIGESQIGTFQMDSGTSLGAIPNLI